VFYSYNVFACLHSTVIEVKGIYQGSCDSSN